MADLNNQSPLLIYNSKVSSNTPKNPDGNALPSLSPTSQPHPLPTSSKTQRNKEKWRKWKEKMRDRDINDPKKKEASGMHLAAQLAHTKTTTTAQMRVDSLPKTHSLLGGSCWHADKDCESDLCNKPVYFCKALRSLHPVPYEYACLIAVSISEKVVSYTFCSYSQHRVADFRDVDGIWFGLHSFCDCHMDEHFMEHLVWQINDFVTSCGIQAPLGSHKQGLFAQVIIGYNHKIG